MAFPVKETTVGLNERIVMEGMAIDGLFASNPSSYAFDGVVTPEANGVAQPALLNGTSVQLGITRCGLAQSIDFWASADTYASFTYGIANGGTKRVVGTGGLRIQPNALCFPKDFIGVNATGLVRPTSPAGNKILATSSVAAVKFAADLAFGAARRILFVGDSNTEAGAMSTTILTSTSTISKEDVYSWQLRKWYNSNGNDVRIIDKSIGGKSSIDYDAYRRNGRLELPEAPDLCIYNLGTNDYDQTKFYNNCLAFHQDRMAKWPNCKFIILGPIPKQGTVVDPGGEFNGQPSEVQVGAMRTKGQLVVTNIASSRLIFVNGGLAFSVADNTQYSNTETDGNHVHMGVTGQLSLSTYIINDITTNHASFIKL